MSQQFVLVRVASINGVQVLENLDGTVRSLNPNGPAPTTYYWSARPAGTNGPFEMCAIDGGVVAYNPLGDEPVLFPFKMTVPGGYSALGIEQLS